MKVSFEIVPRSLQAFQDQYGFVETLGAGIQMINVPDIQRFSLRSWELASSIDNQRYEFVPHLRAIDFDLRSGDVFKLIETYELKNLLVVTGDPPEGPQREYHNTDVVDLIRSIQSRFPNVAIYAGYDPHRQGLQDECNYISRKIDAGAKGFFSQPFYDLRMIEIYADFLQGVENYIGISPITSLASMHYWEVKNKVQFPKNFRPEMEWNHSFTNQAIKLASSLSANIYFMPIRIDLDKFFSKIELTI